jgi:hypothetical protein
VARDIEELAIEVAGHALLEPLAVEVQRARQLHDPLARLGEFRRVDPHGLDRRADCERLAVAVEDRAAVGDDRGGARVAHVRLLGDECLVEHLQLHGAREERERRGHDQDCQEARAPAELRRVEFDFAVAPPHWATISTSAGFGNSIARLSAATRSTIAGFDQELCSSWSLPQSMLSWSRCAERRSSSTKSALDS